MKTHFTFAGIVFVIFSLISCTKEMITENTTNNNTFGYVLYSFIGDKTTHLVDSAGNDVKTWTSLYRSMGSCYLSGNNTLLRFGTTDGAANGTFAKGGATAGIIEELDDESNVIWSVLKDDNNYTFHHDFKEIDDRTIIALTWNLVEYNGRNFWNEKIIIIDKTTNNIVWEWDALKDGAIVPGNADKADYIHFNSVDYRNDSILVSSRTKNTLYLIGKANKSIIATYSAQGVLNGQHDACLLDNGNILVFNNNAGDNSSAVIEINSSDEVVWEYSDNFYSTNISGAQRLESGNTIICSGNETRFIEVTSYGEKVWDFTPDGSNTCTSKAIFKIRKYSMY